MKQNILVVIALLLMSQTSFLQAQDDTPNTRPLNTITTAVPFLIISPDSRSGGMGDAGVATSADANSLHWNTSKLIFSEQETEVSLSYSPWLRGLVDDIKLSYLSGYKKLGNKHAIGGSLRYFGLGTIVFTDNTGLSIGSYTPNEFELLGGYALRLSERMSVGINGKFVFSNLTGQISNGTNITNPGMAGAADLSFSYVNPDVILGGFRSQFSTGVTISNIGNKMSYTDKEDRDFIPTNLRVGTAFKMNFDSYNSLTATVDFNKLLVPTLPLTINDSIISGKNNDVGTILGMIQSFYDAPGTPHREEKDENGNPVIVKNSRFGEEIREINIGGGLEYWYSDILAFRTGYFHESISKGGRQYLTFGAGLKAYSFGLDLSYLVATGNSITSPLANTIRFSLSFRFGDKNNSETKLGEE